MEYHVHDTNTSVLFTLEYHDDVHVTIISLLFKQYITEILYSWCDYFSPFLAVYHWNTTFLLL